MAPVSRSLPSTSVQLFKGQIGRQDQAGPFVGPADHLEEQFGPGLGEGHVAQLIQHEQVQAFQLPVQALQLALFPGFQQMRHQTGGRDKAHPPPLATGGISPSCAKSNCYPRGGRPLDRQPCRQGDRPGDRGAGAAGDACTNAKLPWRQLPGDYCGWLNQLGTLHAPREE